MAGPGCLQSLPNLLAEVEEGRDAINIILSKKKRMEHCSVRWKTATELMLSFQLKRLINIMYVYVVPLHVVVGSREPQKFMMKSRFVR